MNIDENLLFKTIDSSLHFAFQIQAEEGYWFGAVEDTIFSDCNVIFLFKLLNIEKPLLIEKIANRIISKQFYDGSWCLFSDAKEGDLNATIECYLALQLAGYSEDSSILLKARNYIVANGGLHQSRTFTKLWLVFFGIASWEQIPHIPVEIILLSPQSTFSIYSFASWVRIVLVPIMILMTKKWRPEIPQQSLLCSKLISERPFKFAKKNNLHFFLKAISHIFNGIVMCYEKYPWKYYRKKALAIIHDWIVEHQDEDGLWGGFQIPTMYAIFALKAFGYQNSDDKIQKGLEGFLNNVIKQENETLSCTSQSPVWDTGLMLIALQKNSYEKHKEFYHKAVCWLLQKQILVPGDWRVSSEAEPGGWAFEFYNDSYPDMDDTAIVLSALLLFQHQAFQGASFDQQLLQQSIYRGLLWLTSMQNDNGGFAAFDKNNERYFLMHIPFFDYADVLDPACADITAHVIEVLAKANYLEFQPHLRKAIDYLYQTQEKDGTWFGRWGINYIYGTSAALMALAEAKENMQQLRLRRSEEWLLAKQNPDGGWGETVRSYAYEKLKGVGCSTPTQTAWALLGLMAAASKAKDQINHGIAYLLDTHNLNGTWDEQQFTGIAATGMGHGCSPSFKKTHLSAQQILHRNFMLHYALYSHYWPLMALQKYKNIFYNH